MADRPIRPTGITPVTLDHLIAHTRLRLVSGRGDFTVSGVALSDASVLPGDLFVALPGTRQHGAGYATAAIERGARAILTDSHGVTLLGDTDVPIVVSDNPRESMGWVSRLVYDPGVPLPTVLAVTGTNGKTSVAFYLEAICRALGHTTALSNSTERRIAGDVFHTPLTTPEAPELHAMLALAAQRGVHEFALEASAQAIERQRLGGIIAEVSGFTNLSHDHFEDYGDMDNYLEHKLPLFQPQMSKQAVVSLESSWGKTVVERSGVPVQTIAELGGQEADWTVEITQTSGDGQEFVLRGPGGECVTRISALGTHMVRNAALALVMVHLSGVSVEQLESAVGLDAGGIDLVVPGRLEKVSADSPVRVFVDAGRSPDAYRHTFTTLREASPGRLIVVCGTSGNRDRSKRAEMGALAGEFGDVVIVTDDDPRRENPDQIRADLLAGVRAVKSSEVYDVANPVEAIAHAISHATPGDTVVWMGPGSQPYREIDGVKHPFSARQEARDALVTAGLL